MALDKPTGQPAPLAPGEFTPSQPANVVSFRTSQVDLPSSLYIQRDDQLVINAATNRTAEVVTINYRLLLSNGVIIPGQAVVRPLSTRAVATLSQPLAEGFLLSVSANAAIANTRGETFCRVFVNRGAFGTGNPGQVLFADYVTTQLSAGYPGGRVLSPVEGPGLPYQVSVAQPGVGLNMVLAVPANARWLLKGIFFNLTTSATVATRSVFLEIAGNVGQGVTLPAQTTQLASLSVNYSGTTFAPYASPVATRVMVGLPPNLTMSAVAPGEQQLVVNADSLQAGDQFGGMTVDIEEWLDNV